VSTTNLAKAQGVNGLIPALPWPFWTGVGLLLLYVAIQIQASVVSPIRLGTCAASFVIMVQAPDALLYSEPRFSWDFKTVGEVLYDNLHGALNINLDIYQRWPGFFGLLAWFDHVAGITNPQSFLTWCPLFFDLMTVAAFGFAISGLSMTTREKWLAVFLFYAGDWVFGNAQDIFTPQALAFPMFFIVMGMVLRWYLVSPAPLEFNRPRKRLAQFRLFRPLWRVPEIRSPDGWVGERSLTRPGDWKRFALVLVVFLPLVITHPLTPFVLVLELLALTAVNRIRPLWFAVSLGAAAAAYLALNLGFLSQAHDSITGPSAIAQNAAPPTAAVGPVGPNHLLLPAITLVLYGLAVLGVFNRYRDRRDVRTLAVLTATPIVLVGLVHYGAETVYRSLLFSTPWAACLAASAIRLLERPHPVHRQPTRMRRVVGFRIVATFVATAVLAALVISVNSSQNELYELSPGDITAAQWLYTQPPGVAIFLNSEFPTRIGARYDKFLLSNYQDAILPDFAYGSIPVQTISNYACGLTFRTEPTTYIVLSDHQATFATDTHAESTGFLSKLRTQLRDSSEWKLVFQGGTTTIFRGPSGCHKKNAP
jgi:hypothetical protein